MDLQEMINAKRVSLEECGELVDKTVFINRVAKVVKGGRRFSFSALVVTGDGEGHVGFGLGKAGEVPDAIRKGSEEARRNIMRVPIKGTTIPHDIYTRYGASKIVMKPAAPGTGVIAGSVGRAVVESAGIKDIRMKCVGSVNPQNVLRATIAGLLSLKEPEAIGTARGVALEELGYSPY
jgi:small subunit ribosomal protein S5